MIVETFELQSILKSIPEDKHNLFLMEYNDKKKNSSTALLLAILLGGFGAHHFYLGNIAMGVIYLLFSWTGLTYLVAWVEAFGLSKKVHQQNMTIANEMAATLGGNVTVRL